MAVSTTNTIVNLQEKVIGPARMTLKDDVLAIKGSFQIERGSPGMDDTFNSPKMPGVTAFGLSEGVDMSTQTLLAHVPMLFHPNPKTVMTLGYASGITSGETLCYPVDKLDILEISQDVVEAGEFFNEWNELNMRVTIM